MKENHRAHNSKAVQEYQQSNWTLDVQGGGHIHSKSNLTDRDNILQIKRQKWGREGTSDIKAFLQTLCEQQQCFGLICTSYTYKAQWLCFPLPPGSCSGITNIINRPLVRGGDSPGNQSRISKEEELLHFK